MALVNVREVILSTEFCQDIPVVRHTQGEWINAEYQTNEFNFITPGVVTRLTNDEMLTLPEADRRKDLQMFWTVDKLYITQLNENQSNSNTLSDYILWHGGKYKIIEVGDDDDYGFYRSIGERIGDGA